MYGEHRLPFPFQKVHPKNPTNPYGETKWVMERMLQWYGQAYGIRSISLRYFNAAGADPEGVLAKITGPEEHLIPVALLAALGKRDKLKIFGTDWETPDGTCIRDYIHVSNLAEAHYLALKSLRNDGKTCANNLGNGRGFSVKEVIGAVQKVIGRTVPFEAAPRRPAYRPGFSRVATAPKPSLGGTPSTRKSRSSSDTPGRGGSPCPMATGTNASAAPPTGPRCCAPTS